MKDLDPLLLFAIFLPAVLFFALILLIASRFKKVGVHEALVISGGRQIMDPETGERTVVGTRVATARGTFVMPLIECAERLSLEVLRVPIEADKVLASDRRALAVAGVAQVKVPADEASIRSAAEHFLSKRPEEVAAIVAEVIDGHLRAIADATAVEAIQQSLPELSRRLAEAVAPDLARMGLELISCSIKDVRAGNPP